MANFKESHTFEKRKSECDRLKSKYPDKLPIIIEVSKKYTNILPSLPKSKYLLPYDITLAHFISILRNSMKLQPDNAIFLFTGNKIPSVTQLMGQIYEFSKDEDGFLYFTICGESVFGL